MRKTISPCQTFINKSCNKSIKTLAVVSISSIDMNNLKHTFVWIAWWPVQHLNPYALQVLYRQLGIVDGRIILHQDEVLAAKPLFPDPTESTSEHILRH